MPADTRKLQQVIKRIPGVAQQLLDMAAQGIVDDSRLLFNSGPPGREYKRGTRYHVASQPGYPPNVDTGRLRASISWRATRRFERRISDGTNYGYAVEMKLKRPFFGPTFEEWRRQKLVRLAQRMGWV